VGAVSGLYTTPGYAAAGYELWKRERREMTYFYVPMVAVCKEDSRKEVKTMADGTSGKRKRKKYVPKKGFRDNIEKVLKTLEDAKKDASPMEWSRVHELQRRVATAGSKCRSHIKPGKKGKGRGTSTAAE
jgi:hypothetical protein